MNTKDFLRLGVPLGEATRRATNFVAQFILGDSDKSRLQEQNVLCLPTSLVWLV